MRDDWDCVVVGGGAAGLSAALPLGRARRRTLLLDRGGQSNLTAEHIGGLLGQEGTAPGDLYARGHEQLRKYGVEVRGAEAVDARGQDDGFVVVLGEGGEELTTRTLVLATGMDYDVPDVPGFREHWGRAVFHCPFCHGWEVRDRAVAVCAAGEAAEHATRILAGWTDDVTLVDPADVSGVRAEGGELRALVRHDGSEVACDAVMVPAPMRPRSVLPERLGLERSDAGIVTTDAFGRTSVPGVFAAGDLAAVPQVAAAIGSGHVAGVTAARELLLGREAAAA